jgi:hypothetical protein
MEAFLVGLGLPLMTPGESDSHDILWTNVPTITYECHQNTCRKRAGFTTTSPNHAAGSIFVTQDKCEAACGSTYIAPPVRSRLGFMG